ncbi:MAG: rRNA maturation RNAse YbeY [Verrucomicrobiota bacterium]
MSAALSIRNRQRAVPVNVRHLRRFAACLLRVLGTAEPCDLGICLVRPPEMSRLNETFLRHAGATDVIAFDYGSPPGLHGEIFICLEELARYVIHGLLHLTGYDDRRPGDRRRMKLEEDRLLRRLGRCCAIPELARPVGVATARRQKAAQRSQIPSVKHR